MKINNSLFIWAIRQTYMANPKSFLRYSLIYFFVSTLFPISILLREKLFRATLHPELTDQIPVILTTITLFQLLYAFLTSQANYQAELHDIFTEVFLSKQLMQKAVSTEFESWEDVVFLDKFSRIRRGVCNCSYYVNAKLDLFLLYGLKFLSLGFFLALQQAILPLFIVLIILPMLVKMQLEKKGYTNLSALTASPKRKLESFEATMLSARGFRELLTNNLLTYFRGELANIRQGLQETQAKEEKKQAGLKILASLISLIAYSSIILYLIFLTFENKISISVFAAVFFSLDNLFALAEEALLSRYSEAAKSAPELEELKNFLKGDSQIVLSPPSERKEAASRNEILRFRNVSYAYPGQKNLAISNISFSLAAGEHLAVVGANGSGKSTLAKLALGILTPKSGLIEGIDTENMTALFQNFGRYSLPLKENVQISDIHRLGTEQIEAALSLFSFDVEKLPQRLSTKLGKEFGGEELSGGEWQRVALARAEYRQAKLIVLDEPTSAIDPLEEANVFASINKIARNKGMILITHRLALLPQMDLILVLNEGELIATGSHIELLDSCPYYRTLWEGQSSRYTAK